MDDVVVGIDLGTTNSCAAVYLNNRLKILENSEGGRITPSFLFFTGQNGVIVGQYGRKMAATKPELGVFEIKRLLGRSFSDPFIMDYSKNLPFKIKNIQEKLVVVVEDTVKNMEVVKKSPEELCTYILEKIKKDIEAKLGGSVSKTVITVPAYFNIAQREATLAAAKKANFTVLQLLNEPTAAAISYYFENSSDITGHSLVYDLGGGTFDVSILKKSLNNIDILAVDGDTRLGGHDFDNLLLDFVCGILREKYDNYNPKDNRRHWRRLYNECEEAKKMLSVTEETIIVLNALVPDNPIVEISITRDKFESLCIHLFQKTIDIVERCLTKTNLEKSDISKVILCGGSTRIPKIQALITDFFHGKALNKFVNPDECVAEGAALQAAMLSINPVQKISAIHVSNVTALSLGIDNFVNMMTFLIKRNTPIPVKKSINRVNVYHNQKNMTFEVYEGERLDSQKNYHLGYLNIPDLTPAPPGQCSVQVTMSIDCNGILNVSAKETVKSHSRDLKILYARGRRSDEEVRSIVDVALENAEEDERFSKFADLKAFLMKYCIRASYNFDEKGLVDDYEEIDQRCKDILKTAKKSTMDQEKELVRFKDEIMAICEPIVQKYNFEFMP